MRQIWVSLVYLATGLATAVVSWLALGVLLMSVVILPLLPVVAPLVYRLVDFDRARIARVAGAPVPVDRLPLEGPWLHRAQQVLSGARELRWLAAHAVYGVFFGSLAVGVAGSLAQQFVVPLIWWAYPGGLQNSFGLQVDSWSKASLSVPIAVALLLLLTQIPKLAALDARWSRELLAPSLQQRVEQLTATRAAALEAHGAELRRIERNLHDGTQNKLVGVVMMLGIAERTMRQHPENALQAVLRAQDAAGEALEELRNVVRSIHPPVLEDLGLDGAVEALAARCPVPCVLTANHLGRLPAAVEAAAYFAVAEALTNVAKHSGAEHARVSLEVRGSAVVVEVHDDGKGGADEDGGTGLAGIRGRVAALDGTTTVTSPAGGPTVLQVVLPMGA